MATISESILGHMNVTIERLNRHEQSGRRAGKRTAWAQAMLAKLRNAVGKNPAESFDVLSLLLFDVRSDQADLAVHTALTLFATHQQGKEQSVSEFGVSFGTAIRRIIQKDGDKEAGVTRRFSALATSETMGELVSHARYMVQLLKRADITMDYARFAVDLYNYQYDSNRVRMGWGRDFYKFDKKENTDDE